MIQSLQQFLVIWELPGLGEMMLYSPSAPAVPKARILLENVGLSSAVNVH